MARVLDNSAPIPRPVLRPGWTNQYVSPPTPFAEGGRDRDGWDCWGLLRFVYKSEFGIELPSYSSDYETTDDHAAVAAVFDDQSRHWDETTSPQSGDAVWCAVAGHECHVGVYVEPGFMLHVLPERGTVVERITGPAWQNRIKSYFRHQGVRFMR